MAQLWSDEANEQYVGRKAKEITDYLHDKRMLEEDQWAPLQELYDKLTLDEYFIFGILFYMWSKDEILVKRGDDGKILVAAVWDSDRARWDMDASGTD